MCTPLGMCKPKRAQARPGMMATYPLMMASYNTRIGEKAMARERMITRTVATAEYVCMTVNTTTRKVEDIRVSIPSGMTMTEKARQKAITDALPETNTLVQITSEYVKEILYGMTEDDFIKYAKVLPPRTKSDSETE